MKTVCLSLFRWPDKNGNTDLTHLLRQVTQAIAVHLGDNSDLNLCIQLGAGSKQISTLYEMLLPKLITEWGALNNLVRIDLQPDPPGQDPIQLNFSCHSTIKGTQLIRSWLADNQARLESFGTQIILPETTSLELAERLEPNALENPSAMREPSVGKRSCFTLDCSEEQLESAGKMALSDYSPRVRLPLLWAALPAYVAAARPDSHGYPGLLQRAEIAKRFLTSPS